MTDLTKRESKLIKRNAIQGFEDMLSHRPDAQAGDCLPLRHTFTPGIYTREIFLPAGSVLTGKIHRHEHPNFLMAGVVDVFTENGGLERLEAPMWCVSPSGTKRAIHVIEDSIWVTIHANPSNTEDLKELENMVIVRDYNELPKESECLG